MTIKKLDHISVVVEDLGAAMAFFSELGLEKEGEAALEGEWVERLNGIESVQVDIVMMRTPDGHGHLELTKFRNPELVEIDLAKTLSENRQIEQDVGAGQLNQRQPVSCLLRPASAQAASLDEPRDRPLHHPSPRRVNPL